MSRGGDRYAEVSIKGGSTPQAQTAATATTMAATATTRAMISGSIASQTLRRAEAKVIISP